MLGPILIPKEMEDLTISGNKPRVQLSSAVCWLRAFMHQNLYNRCQILRNKILAEASQQKSLKLVVALTPGGNLQTWLCRKKHWLEYQKHSKHNNLRKGSDRGMFSQCELKPGAERRQFHPVNPWDDPPLELAIALILLQPTSFNTLN